MERLLAINLLAPMHLCKLFIPSMREKQVSLSPSWRGGQPALNLASVQDGLLLFVGSSSGMRASKNGALPLYSTSKHASPVALSAGIWRC